MSARVIAATALACVALIGCHRAAPASKRVVRVCADPNNLPLSVSAFTQPGHGSVANQGSGILKYTPAAGFSGQDTFTYTIRDSAGGTATAKVTVTVQPANVPGGRPVTPGVQANRAPASGWAARCSSSSSCFAVVT